MSFESAQSLDNVTIIASSTGGGGTGGNVTIGTTVISVGGSTDILEGLSSVTSAIFNGNLSGTATSTSGVVLSDAGLNQFYFPTLSQALTGIQALHTDADLSYNPTSNTLRVVNISTAADDLNLVPAGNISLQNRDLVSVRTVFTRTAGPSGLGYQAGVATGLPVLTATPDQLSLGSTFTNTPREAIKVFVAQADNIAYGFSATVDALNYLAGTGRHEFYTDTDTLLVSINTVGLQVKPNLNDAGVMLTLGNSNVAAAVSSATPNAIDLGAGVSNSAGANLKLQLFRTTAESYGLGASNSGMDYVVTSTAKTHSFWIGAQRFASINSTTINMFTETTTVGLLNLGRAALTSLATPTRLDLGGTYSTSVGTVPKLIVLNNGTGIGATPTSQEYIVPSGSQHIFYVNGAEIAAINQQRLLLRGQANNLGRVMQIGTLTTLASTTPNMISLGAGQSSTAGANPKIMIYESTSPTVSAWGIGASSAAMEYMTTDSATHGFYINGILVTRISNTGINMQGNNINNTNTVTTTNLTVQSVTGGLGGAINFNSANISGVATLDVTGSIRVPTITSPADLTLNPTGSNVAFSNKNITGVLAATITTANVTTLNTGTIANTDNITINPLTQVDFSNKAITNVSTLSVNTSITGGTANIATSVTTNTLNATTLTTLSGNLTLNAAGTTITFSNKILSGINTLTATGAITGGSIVTPSITSPTLALVVSSATADITFSSKNFIDVGTITSGAITAGTSITVPSILTAVGNLVINPAGTSVDFSNKSITNVNTFTSASINATTVTATTLTAANLTTQSGSLSINPAGSSVLFNNKILSGISDLSAVNGIFSGSVSTPTLTSPTGNLVINSATANITFSNKALSDILSLTALALTGTVNVTTPLLQTSAGNISILPAGTDIVVTGKNITGANNVDTATLTTSTITTSAGNLSINPVGTDVSFNNKNLTNVNTLIANNANTGNIINLGSGRGTGVTTIGAQKILFYSDGSNFFGFSAPTDNALYFNAGGPTYGSAPINFNFGGTTRFTMLNSGIFQCVAIQAPTIGTSAGDITIAPAGANVNFSSKNLTNVASIAVSTITTPSGDLSVNPVGSNVAFNSKNITSVASLTSTSVTTSTITTAAGNLSINPAGTDVAFNSKNITGVASLTSTSITTSTITTSAGNLSISPVGTDVNFNNKNLTNVGALSGTSVTVTTLTASTINTAAGDLSINPAGNNVAFNSKNITGVASLTSTSIVSSTITTAAGNLSINPVGTDVNFNNKNITNVGSLSGTSATLTTLTVATITTAAGNLSINPIGTDVNFNSKNITNVTSLASTSVSTSTIATPSGNLSINPSGTSVDFNGKTIINAVLPANSFTDINVNNIRFPATGPTLIRIFNNATVSNRLNITNDALGDVEIAVAGVLAALVDTADILTQTFTALDSVVSPIVITPSITTSSGNLSIAPAGTAIEINNKDVTNVRSMTISQGSDTAGTVLTIGTRTSVATATTTPLRIDMGTSLAPNNGGLSADEQKILVYSRTNGANVDFAGFSFNNDGWFSSNLNGLAGFQWRWNYSSTNRMILTSGGDLSVTSSFSSPIVTASTRVTTPALTSASGDIAIAPAGVAINCSAKSLTNVNTLLMGNGLSGVGNALQKLQIYRNAGISYGFGVQDGVFSYETPTAPDAHVFYTAQTERARINNAGLRLAVPITTASGDLSINPAGTGVNFNGKNLTSVNTVVMGSTFSTVGNLLQKLRLWDDATTSYGLGVQSGVLSYETPAAADSHVFFTGQTERIRINNAAMTTTVPISGSGGSTVSFPTGITTTLATSASNITMRTTGRLSRIIAQPTDATISTATIQMQFDRYDDDPILNPGTKFRRNTYLYFNAYATSQTELETIFTTTEPDTGGFRIGQSTFKQIGETTTLGLDSLSIDYISSTNVLTNAIRINGTNNPIISISNYTLQVNSISAGPGSSMNFNGEVISNAVFDLGLQEQSIASSPTVWLQSGTNFIGTISFVTGGFGGVSYLTLRTTGPLTVQADGTFYASGAIPSQFRPPSDINFTIVNGFTNEILILRVYANGDAEIYKPQVVTFTAGQVIAFVQNANVSWNRTINAVP